MITILNKYIIHIENCYLFKRDAQLKIVLIILIILHNVLTTKYILKVKYDKKKKYL